MNINGFNKIDPIKIAEAEEWRNLLEGSQLKKTAVSHPYIVLKEGRYALIGSKIGKMALSDIVQISRKRFDEMESMTRTQDLTDDQKRKFGLLASDIAFYTGAIVQAGQAKRDQNKLWRNIALVISAVASFALIGIPFFIMLRRENKQFEKGIDELKKMRQSLEKFPFDIPQFIQSIHELEMKMEEVKKRPYSQENHKKLINLENQLGEAWKNFNSYVRDIEASATRLELPFDQADKYVLLKKRFHEEVKPQLENRDSFTVQEEIKDNFNQYLDEFSQLDHQKEAIEMPLFETDASRAMAFKRIDQQHPEGGIEDLTSLPLPQSTTKLSDAASAIRNLSVHEKDHDWIPILQLAVTQTNLNALFGLPITLLNLLGASMAWREKVKEYALKPLEYAFIAIFSQMKRPPVQLEIIRNSEGAIEKVNVLLEGSLDVIKQDINRVAELNKDNTLRKGEKVIIQDAIQGKLSYTMTLDAKKRPLFSNFEYSVKTNIPVVGAP